MADVTPITDINRRLKREDPTTRASFIIDQAAILDLEGPVIILGDPGQGKSVLAQEIGEQPGFVYVRASSFVRNAQPERLIPNGACLVIDGLDEIASATVGGGVDAILSQLSKLGYPRFILSSREVDWRGAADRIKIEDDYGRAPTILHLLAFDHDDAMLFLRRSFPSVDAESVLTHLAHRGLNEIYKNPLTLRLIGEVAASDEALPTSRAQLLDRACQLLVLEDNPRHQDAAHAHAASEKLLLAAGAYAATQLLCDITGLFIGPASKTPDGSVHVSSIAALHYAEAIEAALHTRLFEAESGQRFHLLHRVIAEYLGAKWLARCFQYGVSTRRLFSLFGQGHGVPTSLRGLHAWLAHFDNTIAEVCVAADPYAVLRYGDAETVPVDIARRLLGALATLSDRDPFFRAEDWGRHPASGLMRTELKDDILALIGTPDQHTHLTLLLVEAMVGSELPAVLEPELRAMMFDTARYYGERFCAADALREMGRIGSPTETIEQLLTQGGEDDRRLAWEVLHDLGLSVVSMDLAIRTLYAHLGLTVSVVNQSNDRIHHAYVSDSLIEALTSTQLTEMLDAARDYGEPLLNNSDHSTKAQVADLVHLAGLCALRLDPKMAASDIWRRLHWVDHDQGYKHEISNALTLWFVAHPDVRRAVQSYVMFDSGCEHARDAAYAFHKCGLHLYPQEDEIIALIEEFDRRCGDAAVDLEKLEELVLLAPRRDGISAPIREAATKIGAGSPLFMAKLEELSKPLVYEWAEKNAAAKKQAEAEQVTIHQSFRSSIAKDLLAVDAGAPNLLYDPANAYLGRFRDFDPKAPPEMRVKDFLGEDLSKRVLQGFMASFDRNDRPSASDIVEMHLNGRIYFAELSLVCGVAERLRRGLGVDDLTAEARESAFMAWRRTSESQISGGSDLKPLEDAVLCDAAAIERFFRTSIEPQLERKANHVYDLHFLGNDPRWRPLAGRLAVEWLHRFPSLPETVEAELLGHATRHAELTELQALAREARSRLHRDYETMLAWLALDFLVDFDAAFDWLVEAAADDRDFLWFIRNCMSSKRDDPDRRLSVAQRQFIVERFSHAWPQTSHPQSGWSGDTNPWDATAMIETSGYAIGGDPSRDATTALEHLIAVADQSYVDPLRHALELQLRARRDSEFTPVSIARLTAVVNDGLPSTIDDMRAFFGDRIIAINAQMHSTATDMWEAYWDGAKPRDENFCRNRLIEHISGQLPGTIRFVPEMYMPQQKRADIAAILGSIGLPVEIKGQWHPEVWIAPVEQLAARYLHDWHAEGRGVYIVLWFGDVSRKNLPVHPDGLARPKTPDDLRAMLIDRLPENLRDVIDVYVVDVSSPTKKVFSSA
ncbi:hypothetical protein JK169_08995 [Acetobacter persici]|uniref:NACHT domain-containing protein n=1 Tax=Acetobacter persici TaxID=1076596 RepID=UPI001BA785CB|nr:hypothetical protein [Acetobacter persici]MBS1001143.1 hypothetical protein [Acetobacter persici]